MRYLNALSPKLVASDLTVVASLDGPDILPVPKGYKKQMAEPHILEPCVTYESGKSDGILKARSLANITSESCSDGGVIYLASFSYYK